MKTLTATLEAAQRAARRTPALATTAYAERGGTPILRWAHWYDGAEADVPGACCVTAAGTLIRVRNTGGTIYYSRVTSPTSGSTYSSWTSLATDGASNKGCAISSAGSTVVIAYVKTGSKRIQHYISTDDGASYGSVQAGPTSSDESGTVDWVAVSLSASTPTGIFLWNNNAVLRQSTLSGAGTWSAPANATPTFTDVRGIAATWSSATTLHWVTISAKEATTANLIVAVYTVDSALSTWDTPAAGNGYPFFADSASTLSLLREPSIALVDQPDGNVAPMVSWTERDTSALQYTRTYISRGSPAADIDDVFWSEPEPFEALDAFGARFAYDGGTTWFLCNAAGVWNAEAAHSPGSGLPIDAAEIISARATLADGIASAELIIDDTAGGYASGLAPELLAGGEIELSAGYAASGNEYGTIWRFRVVQLRYELAATGQRRVRATLAGPWETGRSVRSRQAHDWTASETRAAIWRRAMGKIHGWQSATSLGSTDFAADHVGDLLVPPGAPWASVAELQIDREADIQLLDGHTVYAIAVASSDTSDETFANDGSHHPVYSLTLVDGPPPANWVRVQGPAIYTDAFDTDAVYQFGPRVHHMTEPDAGTSTKVTEYGDHAVYHFARQRVVGFATIPWHAGLEPGDVITISDDRLSSSSLTARVAQVQLIYDTRTARYDAELTLVEV